MGERKKGGSRSAQVADHALDEPAVLSMIGRMEAAVEADIQAQFPAEALAWLEIETTGGETLRSELTAIRLAGSSVWALYEVDGDGRLVELVSGLCLRNQ